MTADGHLPLQTDLRASARDLTELGLERHHHELELFGFTVIRDALDPGSIAVLTNQLLSLAAEDDGRPVDVVAGETHRNRTEEVVLLLARGGEGFVRLALEPRALALATSLLGRSCMLSSLTGYVKGPGSDGLGVHADTAFVPDPLPPYAQLVNVNYCLTDYTVDDGCLTMVPGSHRYCHRPRHAHTDVDTEPIETPAGSAIVFHGNTWHGARPRRNPGVRLTLSVLYSRMYMRPQESYADLLDDAMFDRHPARLRQLVGRELPTGWGSAAEAEEIFRRRKARSGEYYRTRSVHG